MSLYKQFGTSKDAEVDGAWFSYPQPDGSVVELLLARAGGQNTPYQRALRKILRKFARALDVPVEQYPPALNSVCDALATHVLKGWRTTSADGYTSVGIEDPEGKMVNYTIERATTLLLTLPELRNDIQAKASDYRNFQDLNVEELEGNSSPPSSGGSASASATKKPASGKSTG